MPVIIPFIPTILGALGVIATTTAAYLSLAAALAVGLYERDRARKKAKDGYNRSLQDRIFTVRSGVAPRRYALGTIRTGGVLMYADSIGLNKTGFDAVNALASNICGLVGYYIGDEYIAAENFPGNKYGRTEYFDVTERFNGFGPIANINLIGTPLAGSIIKGQWQVGRVVQTPIITQGSGTQITISNLPEAAVGIDISYKQASAEKLRAQFKAGGANQTVTDWSGFASPLWTSAHRLRGVCHIRTLMIWDDNIYTSGAPPVGAVLKGGPVDAHAFYDPRTGTNPNYTDNPAILWAWWRTLPRTLGGMGVPSDLIDWQSVSIAANICDELITVRNLAGTDYEQVKRYQCHTVLSTDAAAAENEDIILGSMAGRRVFTAGKYRVVAGAFRTATVTIRDNNIIGTKPFSVVTADQNAIPPNVVTARFADATANWQETTPKPVQNDSYIAADGREETLDITLPATTDPRQANYLMGVVLESSRPAFTVSLSVDGIGENLALLDTVQLSLTNRAAYSGRTFEVLALIDNWDGTFDLTLAEIKPTTYALDPDRFTPSNPTPVPDNSYLWNVPQLTGFQVVAQTPTLLPDGTSLTRIDLRWDAPPGDYIAQGGRIELRYRLASGEWIGAPSVPGYATSTTITAAVIDNDVYQFQARAVNSLGAAGPWADAWQQISGTPLPSARAIRLRATSFIFHVPASGSGAVEPAHITLTLDRQGGLVAPSTWDTTPDVLLTGTEDSRDLAFVNLDVNAVRIDVEVEQDNVLYLDTITIIKLFDGANGPDYIPDLTPPPQPTGLAATASLFHLFVEWTPAVYTQGHGHASTEVYGALVPPSGPQPTFATAALLGGTPASVYSHPAGTGETWAFWIKHKSVDGVLSVLPAGGVNGVQATTGKIGNVNLGPLIIEAGNLANGSVTAAALAGGIIDATKFASGIEPITVISSGSLPTSKSTNAIYFGGELYRWTGTLYSKTVQAVDLTGTLPANSVGATQITDGAISTPKLTANAVVATNIAAGAVTTLKLAANAVTANELAANSVVLGKVAAGAINAQAIAAGAITTSKLLVSGQGAALNDDPGCMDQTAWTADVGSFQAGVSSSIAPGGLVLRTTAVSGGYSLTRSRDFAVVPGKRYRVSAWARQVSGSGTFYLRLWQVDAGGALILYSIGVEGLTLTNSFVRYSGVIDGGATATQGSVRIWTSYPAGPGVADLADIRCEEVIPGELIVDGAITATKLAANSIAVGTAAIQNGAIVNAMIGSAAIDDAKISNLSAAKITAGTLDVARIGAGSITTEKLAVLSQGGTSIDMSNGRIVFNNGAFMRVTGTGFGNSNQFLDWYGAALGSVASCTEDNASWYLKTNGQSYFGGALSANVAKNSVVGTDTAATASVTLGPFGSFGNPIQVTVAYAFERAAFNHFGNAEPAGGPAAASITIERRTTGAWVTVGASPLSAVQTLYQVNHNGPSVIDIVERIGGSVTFTDSNTGTSAHEYRATITSRTLRTLTSDFVVTSLSQSVTIISVENLT